MRSGFEPGTARLFAGRLVAAVATAMLCMAFFQKPGAARAILQDGALLLAGLVGFWHSIFAPTGDPRELPKPLIGSSSALIGWSCLALAAGFGINVYYDIASPELRPFPSLADAAFLGYTCLICTAMLRLPSRPLPGAMRGRVLLDSVTTMAAVFVLSWYYLLEPMEFWNHGTQAARLVSLAYPVGDLICVLCLLLLSTHMVTVGRKGVLPLLAAGLLMSVSADMTFSYEALRGNYHAGFLTNVGWFAAILLIGWSGYLFRAGSGAQESRSLSEAVPILPMWRTLLPYVLLAVLGVLIAHAAHAHAAHRLQRGLAIGSGGILALVLLRQVLAILENHALNWQLRASLTQAAADARQLSDLNLELGAAQELLQARNEALSAANTQLEALATTDPLTGLRNHRAMVTAINGELDRSRRYERSFSLLFLDLDHFKAINDSSGHQLGDEILKEFAELLSSRSRGVDTLGRWGGEEFVALLPETDHPAAAVVAENLRAAVADTVFSVLGIHLTCSVGVATFPDHGLQREAVIAAADHAMYAAKRLGRNQVRSTEDPAVAALIAGNDSREDIALLGTVQALATLVGSRDQYSADHAEQVGNSASKLALALELSPTDAYLAGLTGRLQDIGKIAVPDVIICKPGPLTEDEWISMRLHPVVSAEVLSHIPALRPIVAAVRAHHERWDGGGYPDGLGGEAIPLAARIVSVVDAFHAMTTDRPYRSAMSESAAALELRQQAGKQFDARIVDAFLAALALSGTSDGATNERFRKAA